jgi:hypothetical protein
MHRPDGLQPERHGDADAVLHPCLALSAVPTLDFTDVPQTFSVFRLYENVAVPPLLQDLFHNATLLLL